MNVPIDQVAKRIGMHPRELVRAVLEGEVSGEVPLDNPLSKQAWVDLLSLRNYIQWLYEQDKLDELRYQKAIRQLDAIQHG